MSRINRVPFGLQDLLGSQNFGDNPSELSRVVAPTLEMTPFLTAERTSYVHTSASKSTNGQIVAQVVPDGEIWYLVGCGVSVIPTSGTPSSAYGCNIGVDMSDLPSSDDPPDSHALAGFEFRNETPFALTTVQRDYKGVQFPIPIPAFSGTSLIWYLSGMYGDNNWAIKLHTRYVKALQ